MAGAKTRKPASASAASSRNRPSHFPNVRIDLLPAAIGDIETPRFSVEEGAIFNGKCKMLEGKISLEELSDYLSIEERKIIEWVDGGKIPVERDGDRLLFDRKEVETWVSHNP